MAITPRASMLRNEGVAAPLAACYRYLSADLVQHRVHQDFERLAAGIPEHLLWTLGFEARLGADDDRVDHFLGYDHLRPWMLVEATEALTCLSPASSGTVWHGLRRFGARWQREEQLRQDVDHMWLEFDADPPGTGQPGVFLERTTPPAEAKDPSEWSDRCFDAMHEISGFDVASSIRTEVRRCLSVRPASSFPSSLGFFLGRPHSGVRLCLKGLGPRSLATYLARLGWPGDAERVAWILSTAPILPGRTGPGLGMLHLDVTESLQPRIGVELVFGFIQQVRHGRLRCPLLEWLRASGLCSERKANALEAWPGAHFAQVFRRAPRQLYLRRVNHTKIEFDASEAVRAKAYFGARMHMPRYLGVPDGRHRIPGLADHDW